MHGRYLIPDNAAPISQTALQELSDWLIESALHADSRNLEYQQLFAGMCERLVDIGVPIMRVGSAMTTLHPLMEAVTLLWTQTSGTLDVQFHEHRSNERDDWQRSPLKALIDSGSFEARYDLSDQKTLDQFPLLQELAGEGVTEYIAFLIPFTNRSDDAIRQDGMMLSYATEVSGGFTDQHISVFRRLIPRIGIVAKLANRERITFNILYAYLGEKSGDQVLNGQIKLGDGHDIRAVIWFSDLRNSTPLAEKLSRPAFLELLNDYFDSMANAVQEHGGEVLRFIGDAALAIFPIGDSGYSETEARERALRAATDAYQRAKNRNDQRTEVGKDPFQYGIGLHVGEIMYGNIGVPNRIEFSVIGAAANEAARLEGLTKDLKETVLVSGAFADGLNHPWRTLGEHPIKGSRRSMSIFAPQIGTYT